MNAPASAAEQEQFNLGDETQDAANTEPPRMIARINSVAAKIVFPFAAQDDIRYYLNGINIRPLDDETGGVMVCACDGHRLIVLRDPDGYVEEEIIVRVVKDALKHAKTENTFDVMSNGAVIFNDKHGLPLFIQPGNSLIEGKFPRFEHILNLVGYRDGISGAVNADYLRDALRIDTGNQLPSIRFWTRDNDSPLIFTFDQVAGLEAVGAIMKLRDAYDLLPRWIPEPSAFELTQESSLSAVERKQQGGE